MRPSLRRKSVRSAVMVAASQAGLALASAAQPVAAQVIEIQPDGASVAYAGPVLSLDNSRQPIVTPARTMQGAASCRAPRSLAGVLRETSGRRQLSAQFIEAVAWQESRLNQNAVSPKGARGIMQLTPSTARALGVDSAGLRDNLDGGAAYLASLLRQFDGDIVLTLAAYNAGPAAVRRWGGVPPYAETRAYVAAVLDRLAQTGSCAFSESR